MVRVYTKVKGLAQRRKYDVGQLEAALRDVKSGRDTLRGAAVRHCVPFSTLRDHAAHQSCKKYGGQAVLSTEEEHCLTTCLKICADWGFPISRRDLRSIVHNFLERRGRQVKVFKDNAPGKDWVAAFLGRHADLTERLAQNVKRARAELSEKVIDEYFENLKTTLEGVPAANIVNYDETGFSDDPGKSKAIFRRGSRTSERVIDHSKVNTSVMFAISASGRTLPPYILYKAKYIYDSWTEGGPPRAMYDSDESGWFTMGAFENWFNRVAIPYFRSLEGPKVLIGDNYASHVSDSVVEACQDLNIKFVLLPANSTHICQPLDVVWFRPIKAAWREALAKWSLKRRGTLSKAEFPRLLKETLDVVGDGLERNAVSSFKATGIYPLDPSKVLGKLFPNSPSASSGPEWTNILVDHLKSFRTNSVVAPVRRGKRLILRAGSSLQRADLERARSKKTSKAGHSEARSARAPELSTVGVHAAAQPSFGEGDFVMCRYETQTDKRVRGFIGRVISIRDDRVEVDSVRCRLGSKQDYFFYPQVRDVLVVRRDEVLQRLDSLCDRRGRIIFRNFSPRDHSTLL